MPDSTHDPNLTSWVESANTPGTPFPIQNLPYCTFHPRRDATPRPGVAIGTQILDLAAAFQVESIQALTALPQAARRNLRAHISAFLANYTTGAERYLTPIAEADLLLPVTIGDYTDFYASLHHATNVGSLFRPNDPLLPNYKWIPVAYHGRASTVVCSGTPVRRPYGQVAAARTGPPRFAPTSLLDYEVELGAFLGPGDPSGEPIPVARALEHMVGVCLLNDWSARDIQAWEYQPLGPFLSKNFATSISPWIVTTEALEPFRCAPAPRPASDPPPLDYLQGGPGAAFHITLEAWLQTSGMTEPVLISRAPFASLYWTLAQMIAHHTINGCVLRPGDLIGSGTVSGPEKINRGCLLELTRGGSEPFPLPNGETRTFLEDRDEVILRGWCEAKGYRTIGLGECRGRILPASPPRRV